MRLSLEQGLDKTQILQPTPDGQLRLNLPRRQVVISNHQVYLDWMFVWGKPLRVFAN